MTQVFSSKANMLARVSLLVILFGSTGLIVGLYSFEHSPYVTRAGIYRAQQLAFSHKHHVEGLGIDCRYCHTSVEKSSFAGIPSTSICMNCHSQIWRDSPMLAPVRNSYENHKPIQWTRVYDLPDFVYFNHSIHVNKGIACVECHGRIDRMPLTKLNQPLFMQWCLNCHRNPEKHLRPQSMIFTMNPQPKISPQQQKELMKQYHIRKQGLTDCYTCHR